MRAPSPAASTMARRGTGEPTVFVILASNESINFRGQTEQKCDMQRGFRAFFTSPRLRGEVDRAKRGRVRGLSTRFRFAERPLTPTLSPQERGEGEDRTRHGGGTRVRYQLSSV